MENRPTSCNHCCPCQQSTCGCDYGKARLLIQTALEKQKRELLAKIRLKPFEKELENGSTYAQGYNQAFSDLEELKGKL
jgi:hypothetical protein